MDEVIVVDNFLGEQEAKDLREKAIKANYVDWKGPDGEIYKRICVLYLPEITAALKKVCGPIKLLGQALRLNYDGEMPNAAIHSDVGCGTHAMVLYLNDGPSGTAFWRHRESGATKLDEDDIITFCKVRKDWGNVEDKWDLIYHVPMKYNRASIYSSKLFHSRYPFEAFGSTPEDGRLIVVAFFTPTGEESEEIQF